MSKLTVQAVGEHLGLSRQAASFWLRKLGLTLDAGLDAIRLAYCEALRRSAAVNGHAPERARLLIARAAREELKLRREQRDLPELRQREEALLDLARAARDSLLVIPRKLLADLPPPHGQRACERADELIRQALTDLADGAGGGRE